MTDNPLKLLWQSARRGLAGRADAGQRTPGASLSSGGAQALDGQGAVRSLAARQRDQFQRAFRDVELAAVKLRAQMFYVALALIAAWILYLSPDNSGLYWIGLAALIALTGTAHYFVVRSRYYRGWHKYFFAATMSVILTYALLQPSPFIAEPWPAQMLLRSFNFTYYYVVLALMALSFSPQLVLFSGFANAACWAAGAWFILRLPETKTMSDFSGPTSFGSGAERLAFQLQPTFVNVDGVIQDCVLMLVTAVVLSIGVGRARAIAFRQMVGERERANLARYFSPSMVDVLARRDRPLGAPRKQSCAILFADVVGFSALSERIGAERTMALLREIHGMMASEVFRCDGTVDKYIGDAIMATFGTPTPGPRDAHNALECARSILERIANWNKARSSRSEETIQIGIGIHYGPVVLGDIGDERRLEFAVIGDTVNVASRLEALTREHSAPLIVSAELLQAASIADPAALGLRLLGTAAVRGRQATVRIYGLAPAAAAQVPLRQDA